MNLRARRALLGSIQKWEAIVAGTGEDMGTDNCPLCKIFLYDFPKECRNCPVQFKTKRPYCSDSPYTVWNEHKNRKHDEQFGKAECPECFRLAQAELDFLKSLLLP